MQGIGSAGHRLGIESPIFLPTKLGKVPDSPLKHIYLNSAFQSVDKPRWPNGNFNTFSNGFETRGNLKPKSDIYFEFGRKLGIRSPS